ncbi:MAG TPA: beta-propeller fold lactonase family protein, partial [Ruminiclostridium sp.]|nr:beta-propeller fold lactonase family protein [Ruminiclostridium sp.]
AVCMSGPIFNIYKLDYTTRKLTTVPSGQINYVNDLLTSSFSPNGLYVYTGIAFMSSVDVASVDQGTGSLLTSTYTNNNSCSDANQIIFHPSGTVVYVGAKSIPAKINRYTVSPIDGTFGFLEECLLGTPGYYIGAMAIERTGRYLFAAAYGDSGILSSIPIDANGALIQGSIKTISAISYVRKLVVDPNGRYLYMAASYDGAQDYLKVYQINADASLLELSTFDFGTTCNDVVSLSGV